ncbi:hypothetical protein ACFQ4C_01400 [Larkinella insperata]|uniref:DUF3575 domain-containing protein n=1 Tax=Larkinella insperata TaxID=332158 RepID=A0ABW3QDT8_9BACT|nr:hypothetical protein [Larkinella insperata]
MMKNFSLILLLLVATLRGAQAQRQEISVSPVGFVHPKFQVVQYERYLGRLNSVVISAYHNSSQHGHALLLPPRVDRFRATKLGIGYRRYYDLQNNILDLFASVRVLGDYSVLQLEQVPRYAIPADSLRAAGFSLAADFSVGGKFYLFRRVTLAGALGFQSIAKLFSTQNITQHPDYWNGYYWTNDNQTWDYKRNVTANFRKGWRPSVQVTLGVVLGKLAKNTSLKK